MMIMSIFINSCWFLFGIMIGLGAFMSDAIEQGYMIQDKKTNRYVWKKDITKIDINNDN